MGKAKKIIIKPIRADIANKMCVEWHYSKKVVPNSQLHFGAFYYGKCRGVLQFGPSMAKRKMAKSLNNIGMNDFLELNRMAFSDELPKNSESRALRISMMLIKKHYPQIRLILSFADGTQCGDGTIYRASGFDLLAIKKNVRMLKLSPKALQYVRRFIPAATDIIHTKSLDHFLDGSKYITSTVKKYGAEPLAGYQYKYAYFIDKNLRNSFKLLPFSKIGDIKGRMYRGKRLEHESNAL